MSPHVFDSCFSTLNQFADFAKSVLGACLCIYTSSCGFKSNFAHTLNACFHIAIDACLLFKYDLRITIYGLKFGNLKINSFLTTQLKRLFWMHHHRCSSARKFMESTINQFFIFIFHLFDWLVVFSLLCSFCFEKIHWQSWRSWVAKEPIACVKKKNEFQKVKTIEYM